MGDNRGEMFCFEEINLSCNTGHWTQAGAMHSVTCRRKYEDIEIENFSKLELNSTLSL